MNPNNNNTAVPTTGDTTDRTIPQDWANQIVQSDDGKEQGQIAAVEQLMQSCQDSEIHTAHTWRMHQLKVTATSHQARALHSVLLDYANHVHRHWDRHGHDLHRYGSIQRLEQARDLIRRINRGLSHGDHDGRTVAELETEAEALMHDLSDVINVMLDRIQRADIDTAEAHRSPATVDAWRSLRDQLQHELEGAEPNIETESETPDQPTNTEQQS